MLSSACHCVCTLLYYMELISQLSSNKPPLLVYSPFLSSSYLLSFRFLSPLLSSPCLLSFCYVYCCGARQDDAEAFPTTLMGADTEPCSLLFTTHHDSQGPLGCLFQTRSHEHRRRRPTAVSDTVDNHNVQARWGLPTNFFRWGERTSKCNPAAWQLVEKNIRNTSQYNTIQLNSTTNYIHQNDYKVESGSIKQFQ